MSKKFVTAVINSRDRRLPLSETSSNFTFSFNKSLNRIKEIRLNTIQIPYTFYPINSNNNVLTFNDAATSITITPGNYTTTTLSAELKTKIEAAFIGDTATITFSTTTLKLTIAKTSPFKIDSITDEPTSTAAPILGFQTTTSTATSVTADGALNISGPDYILVTSTFFSRFIQDRPMFSDNSYQNVLTPMPISTTVGDYIIFEPCDSIVLSSRLNITTSSIIDIQLRDSDSNILDLNKSEWSILLTFITE